MGTVSYMTHKGQKISSGISGIDVVIFFFFCKYVPLKIKSMNNLYCCQTWLAFIFSKLLSVWRETPLGPSGYVTLRPAWSCWVTFWEGGPPWGGEWPPDCPGVQPWPEASCDDPGAPWKELNTQSRISGADETDLSPGKTARQKIEIFHDPPKYFYNKSNSTSYFLPSLDREAATLHS